ncbi:TPA: 2-oxoglutarate synthase [candidate division CPR2 bacterium]|uniref:2-oxoglutarate synthase n=1 Tax=candidate division CPR2 bacterium GW2011_GWC1_41_48 TaxID=1618344 RepID=A0A0G0YHU2_UNCC2|nr:MAG: 2-oxoglutarate synthase [candidate division CPR2 bacterium GW2011_GWC2_39_35]KKS09101.1 MAG: 2-oxoglutarate synthase [candidate division CPR2 bacterium GW2011_GWC1_41_48]HBG81826.1 2-oxoglutarate synthase [candidate division CPR2 bacterium]HCM00002.1 2-oxoglutarate synthase [candidate division CPR2 bacterium]
MSVPSCYKKETKPAKFCPGCGHSIVLKMLGQAIDELGIQKDAVFSIDIGCSLLAWDFYDVDTVQTHHGRTTPVAVGIKRGNPKSVVIAYTGDGGAYAIGLQSLLHSALRQENVTVITVNNTLYAMTGGQAAPTTMPHEVTDSTPNGDFTLESPLMGPELVSQIGNGDLYIARGSVSNPMTLKKYIKKAITHQMEGKGFSFVEALSICPTNWKTDAKGSFEFLKTMEEVYKLGEINRDGTS